MSQPLLELLRGHEELADLDPAARRLALRAVVRDAVPEDAVRDALGHLIDWIDGFGPLSSAIADPAVSDILVNGSDEVWVDRAGLLERIEVSCSPEDLTDLIERLLASCGARADASSPIADGRLRDGSRIHVVLPPISGSAPLVSIRKFPQMSYTLDDLVAMDFMTVNEATRLRAGVIARETIAISGGTGSGKTTLANALLACIPSDERVIVIEETPELRPVSEHQVSLVTRPPNVEGKGGVDLTALLRAALRMRPDRIVIGEVRGPEASVAMQAMATGHEGSLLTVHAASAADVTDRLVDLALMASDAPSETALRRRVPRSLDLVVHAERRGRVRRLVEIMEVP